MSTLRKSNSLVIIVIVLEANGWHVDYHVKDPHLNCGGPHYLIEPRTGAILAKRYEQ